MFNFSTVSVPLWGSAALLFYRQDVFRHYSLTVPATWADFVALAARMVSETRLAGGDGMRGLRGCRA